MRKVDLKDKDILVVGLGLSGYAAASLLAGKGYSVRVTDGSVDRAVSERAERLRAAGIRVETGGHTGGFCAGTDLMVVSPGVPRGALPFLTAEKNGTPVIGELELGFMFCEAPVIAVTGTNGKSTVTELIGHILAGAGRNTIVCGNIGEPLCGMIDDIGKDSVVVAEVSSFQLETIVDFRPQIAVLLNISEDHYDRHGTMKEYRKQKFRIFENQGKQDHAVVHESLEKDSLFQAVRSRKHVYGTGKSASGIYADNVVINGGERNETVIPVGEVPLKGVHNLENTVCACLTASLAGVEKETIRAAVRGFKPLCHRFETVGRSGGIEYINDSKATNIDAAKRALESISRPVVLIAGGIDKGGDYGSVADIVRQRVRAIVAIGEAAGVISRAFRDKVPVHTCKDMASAVKKASLLARNGDAVMLSPMCSSFDMYSSYKERGDDFRHEVTRLSSRERRSGPVGQGRI